MNRATTAMVAVLAMVSLSGPARAGEVTTGKVVRGLVLPLLVPPAAADTPTGRTCDFSNEEVTQPGRLTGASVNCRAGETNVQALVMSLPGYFTAYCVMNAPVKSATLNSAPVPGNANHCDLSGITPNDAKGQFGGALWR